MDLNAVAADASAQLAKDFVKATLLKAADAARFYYETLNSDFADHLAEVHQRVSLVKIITSKDAPVDFSKVYVSASYRCGNDIYTDKQLISIAREGRRCVLSGNGGAGKTFALRQIWLEIVRQRHEKAPVLIELRKLNSLSSYSIENFIRVNAFGTKQFSEKAFDYFCGRGSFVFLLDGFDEVLKEKREELERQILELSKKYRRCGFVVSGRPDGRFDSWTEFHTFKAMPLEYDQFRSLMQKVPFDGEIKKNFLKVASPSFFQEHQSFLSNPLLSLMMLLTFRDNADIPDRVSAFYENCFSTLYAQHDALKESFHRKKSLDQLRFKKVFSAFCFYTYRDSKTSLNEVEFLEYIEKAKKLIGVSPPVEDLRHDFLESVNLLVRDGLHYTFIHRSFQEFFAAYCATYVLSDKAGLALSLFARRRHDNTLSLAYELHQNLVERELIIPKFNRLIQEARLPRRANKAKPFAALSLSGFSIEVVLRSSNHDQSVRYRPFSASFDWSKDYGDLDAACDASAGYSTAWIRKDLEHEIADDVVGAVWGESYDDWTEKEEDEAIFVEVNFSFTNSGLLMRSQNGVEVPPEALDSIDTLTAELSSIASSLEAKTIDNNRKLVQFGNRVIAKSLEDDDLIGLQD